ncbi:MAG: type 11 methyltransferase [Acidobacteria bacterium]|nr:type 11 methyltransferase [Acidobacteriota bacterium]
MKDNAPRIDYGIDAPGVIRNLFIAVALGLIAWVTAFLGLWSGRIVASLSQNIRLSLPLSQIGAWMALGCGFMACWMLWDSRIGKVRDRERLLDKLAWTGREQVLDIGCGRGLLLIGAAKRLTSGMATGIDIWQAEDLSGNRPESTLENAKLEGVADRVQVRSADMREIPFPAHTFDIVVSCAAIHNLYSAVEREKALVEIVRVLKPDGQMLIDDIRHYGEYRRVLTAQGCAVSRVSSLLPAVLLAVLTMGSLCPATLVARKTG